MRRAAKAGIVAGAVIAVAGMGALAVGPLGAGALTEARSVGDFPWSSAVDGRPICSIARHRRGRGGP